MSLPAFNPVSFNDVVTLLYWQGTASLVFCHRQQLPLTWDSLEHVAATLGETNIGSSDQIRHGPRDQNLAGLSDSEQSRGHVNGETGYVALARFNFTCVETCANFQV
jgi:hypothetical protein